MRSERARRAAEARRWRQQLDLPPTVRDLAFRAARSSGPLLDAWLSTFVAHALRELDDSDSSRYRDPDGSYAQEVLDLDDVIPLRRSWR